MTFRVKFHRAIEQLKSLERDMDAWIATNPYTVAQHVESQTGEHVGTALLREEPLVEWPPRIGECLYNFRSALDQLAFELAERHTGSPLPAEMADRSEFPIFGRRPPTPKELADKIGGIHPDAQAIIEGLQPHLRGDPAYQHDPLWMLDRLGNLDKHRALHLVPLSQTGATTTVTGGAIEERFVAVGPIRHGTEVLRWIEIASSPGMKVEINLPYFVSFSQGPPAFGQPVIATLVGVWDRIASDVFSPLARFLH